MIQLATHNHPNNGANGHRQQNVSPPPLKRRRTEFSTVSSHQNSPRPSPSALPVRLSYSSESFPSSEVRVTETLSDTMTQASEPHVRDSGDAVSTGTVLRVFQRLDRSLDDDERPSTSSSLTRSDRSSGSTSKRHLCGVCKMGSTTKFNPMVPCTSCRRRYHDGCRKPALDEGADDDTWKCWKCLERKQRPKHSLNLSHRPEQGSLVNANTTSRSPYIGENLHRAEYDVQGELNPLPTRISQPSPLSMEMSFSAATLSALLDSSINEKAGLIERTRMSREKLQSRPKHHGSEGVQLANTIDYDELDKMVDDSIKPSNRSMNLEQARGEKPISRTMLCPTCQKQRVLINSGSEEPKCHNCRSQTTVAVTGERVIPETPDSAPQTLDRAAGHSPSPWFESNLVTPSRRITKKTATAQLVNLPVGLRRTQELRLESERVVSTHVSESIRDNEERSSVANDPTVNGPDISEDRDAIGEAAISKGIVEQSATSSAQVPSNQRAQQLSVKEAGKEDGRAPVNDSIMKPFQESAKEQPRARGEGIDLISLLFSDEPETTPGSTVPSLPVQAPVKLKPGYHLRAVIAMALLANDRPLLVSEIQECIAAASLPDYRRGEGRWEKNTSAILSQYNDFRGEKVPGQIKNRWSFADPITKAKYEKLYPEYEDLMGNGNRHLAQSPLLEETENTSESPIEPLHSNLHQSNPVEVVETHYDIPSSLATESESEVDSDSSITASDVEAEPLETDGIPFERSPSRRRQISLCLEQDVKRESSFHKIFPECKTKSIETMTRAEKTAKIAEIKSRPSRKAMFGSRLAHVRRHGLEDVHDERDGAWRPLATPRLQRVECGHDEMEMRDKGEEKSFRDIFDLPQNPIPMVYDDQLAFRDGTRVNGRLPRPRNVYKVGKRFGGEIRNLD